jgi:hypothetical protein
MWALLRFKSIRGDACVVIFSSYAPSFLTDRATASRLLSELEQEKEQVRLHLFGVVGNDGHPAWFEA